MFGMITYINTNLLVLQGNYESLVLVRGVDTEVRCFAQLLSLQSWALTDNLSCCCVQLELDWWIFVYPPWNAQGSPEL